MFILGSGIKLPKSSTAQAMSRSDEIRCRNYEIICKTDSQVSLRSASREPYCSPGVLAGRFFGLIGGSHIETVLCLQTTTNDK